MRYARIISRIVTPLAALALVAGIAYSPSFTPKEHVAKAFPAFEINPAIVTGVTATAVNATVQTTIKQVLDGLAWSVAKMTVQSITRSTVNWINSGFQGSPAFVSDLRENLSYLGDAVADDFFNHLNQETQSLTGFNLTSPFQDQINQQLRAEFYRTTGSWGINQFYTLNKTTDDPKAFVQQGKFAKGGFNAWFSASQNPGNNPFGAYQLASDQLWGQIDAAAQARKAELGWSKGFLPWRGNCAQQTSGNVSLGKSDKCLFSAVKTPGSVIESQLEGVMGSGIRQLELADSINEIVAALIGQMVNQVLGGNGIAGLSQPAPGGGQSYVTQATDSSAYAQINSTMADGVLTNIASDRSNITKFQQDWQKVLTAANAAQQRCGTRSEITTAMEKANAGIAKANAALQQLSTIQASVIAAKADTTANQGTAIATATTAYTSFLSSNAYPTGADFAEAGSESTDTSDDPDSTQSYYSQMVKLQATCSLP